VWDHGEDFWEGGGWRFSLPFGCFSPCHALLGLGFGLRLGCLSYGGGLGQGV
jgi:hypothetical protein